MTISRDFKIENHYPSMLSNTSPHPTQQGLDAIAALEAVHLPEIKDMANSPKCLHMNDRAFWVLGWNECRDAAKSLIAHIAELEAQLAAVQQAVQDVVDYAKDLSSAVGSGKYEDFENIKRSLDEAIDAYESATHPTHQGLDAAKFNRLELEIRGITKMLPEKFDCSGVWAAFEAAQAKQGGV